MGGSNAYLLPASYMQRRIVEHVGDGVYADNVSRAWRIEGELDADQLQNALDAMAARHETLRTGLARTRDGVRQLVLEHARLRLRRVDLAPVSRARRGRHLTRLAIEEAEAPFVLAEPPLVRVTLVRAGERDHVLLLIAGHAIWDAASTGVFARDLWCLYADHALPELPLQYGDLVAGRRAEDPRAIEYWTRLLADASPAAPACLRRPGHDAEAALAWARFDAVPAAVVARLAGLSRSEHATLGVTLLAAFAATVARACGVDRLTLAMEHANRELPEMQPLIAFAIDALIVAVDVGEDPPFRQLVRSLREQVFASYRWRVPISSQLRILRGESTGDALPAMHELVLNPISELRTGETIKVAGLRITALATPKRGYSRDAWWPKATLLTTLLPTGGGRLGAYAEYNPNVIDPMRVTNLGRMLTAFMGLAAAAPDRRVGRLAELASRRADQRADAEPPRRSWCAVSAP